MIKMTYHFNRSITLPFKLTSSLRSSFISQPNFHFKKSFQPQIKSTLNRSSSSSSSSSNHSSSNPFKEFISDLNLIYTLPISLLIGIGSYTYLHSQLSQEKSKDDDDDHHHHQVGLLNRTLKFSKEPLPSLIDLSKLDQTPMMIDPDTQLEFSNRLESNQTDDQESLRLIGVGVRTVSFLNIKVYSIGFYVDSRVLRALRVVPGWNEEVTKERLFLKEVESEQISSLPSSSSDSSSDIDEKSSNLIEKRISGERMMRNLINVPVQFALQIAPARSTDFTHLRDGFCRSLTSRLTHAIQNGLLTELEAERASESIHQFRSFFPSGVSVPKGKTILLRKTSNGSLSLEYDGKRLGKVDDPLIARELFLAYFSDVNPISPKFKASVAEGFEKMYK
ncbi:chalcone-flavanone isomerase-domain-containing protein [Melampsora americana]|nr:chalcone-flavanone isomerase-domain-containing protein [Melampsora americana]